MNKEHFIKIITNVEKENFKDERDYNHFFIQQYNALYLTLKKENSGYNLEKFYKEMSLYVHPDKIGAHVSQELKEKFAEIPFRALTTFKNMDNFPMFSVPPIIQQNKIDSFIKHQDSLFVYNSNLVIDILSFIKEMVVMPLHISAFLVNIPKSVSGFFQNWLLLVTVLTSSEEIKKTIDSKVLKNILLKYAPDLNIQTIIDDNALDIYITHAMLMLALIEKLNLTENFNNKKVNLPLLTEQICKKYALNVNYFSKEMGDFNALNNKVLQLLSIILQLERNYPDTPSRMLFQTYYPDFKKDDDFVEFLLYFDKKLSVHQLTQGTSNLLWIIYLAYPLLEVMNDNQYEIYAEKWKEMTDNFDSMPLDEKILTTLNWMLWSIFYATTQTLHCILSSVSDFAVFALKCVEASILGILSAPIQLASLFKTQEVDSEVSNEIILYQPGF